MGCWAGFKRNLCKYLQRKQSSKKTPTKDLLGRLLFILQSHTREWALSLSTCAPNNLFMIYCFIFESYNGRSAVFILYSPSSPPSASVNGHTFTFLSLLVHTCHSQGFHSATLHAMTIFLWLGLNRRHPCDKYQRAGDAFQHPVPKSLLSFSSFSKSELEGCMTVHQLPRDRLFPGVVFCFH